LSSPLWSFVGQSVAWDETDVTKHLNEQIQEGDCGVYCGGGRGVLIRNPYDGYETKSDLMQFKVVPATFWHNDIVTSNSIFPSTGGSDPQNFGKDGWGVTSYNVDCPNNGNNGFFDISPNCDEDPGTGDDSPWRYASTGYVIGDKMENFMPHWDNVQDMDWGWGVFYPTDSNSVDFRCRWREDQGKYECPPDPGGNWAAGWIDGDTFTQDDTLHGPGSYPQGNPFADESWGGGTGCHSDKRGNMKIDQTDAWGVHEDGSNWNLVQDSDCQCNYGFHDNWDHWVSWWIDLSTPKDFFLGDEQWLGQGGVLAPNRALDQVACWMNNPRDMINLQNAIWWRRMSWANQQAPHTEWQEGVPETMWGYWGWNEVPMALDQLIKPENHQTIFVHLPNSICGGDGGKDSISCLPEGHQLALENDLDNWVNGDDHFGYLVPGIDNLASRPGSYIVIVREWYDASNDRWRKFFFCENWQGPGGKYQIVSYDMTAEGNNGACYVDFGSKYHRFYGTATNVGKVRHTMDEIV